MTGRPKTASLYKKVGIASAIMMTSVLLSRFIGLLREAVIAYSGGAQAEVDAYQLAFVLPEFLNHLVATGFLSVTFIPIFNQYLVNDNEEEGWKSFSIIFITFGSLLLGFILILLIWTEPLVGLVAPGLKDMEVKALAVRMTRIVLPGQFFFFAGGLFMAVQFSKERFFIPALAPLIYNTGIIIGGLALGPWIGMEGFSWGALIGALAGNFILQWFGASRSGMKFTLNLDLSHPDLRRYLLLTAPLMLGLSMTFSTEFLFRFFGSYLPKGTIASLNYGIRIMLVLVGLFGQAIGSASFPFMSRLAAEGRMHEMNRLLNQTIRYLALVIPFSALLIVLRYEVVYILFERGKFDAAATDLTSSLLPFLLVGAFAFSAQTVVVRGYYAMKETLFPSLFGTAAVLLSIPFFVAGMNLWGARGVALGVSLSALFQAIILYILWNRRSSNLEGKRVFRRIGEMIFLSILLGTILEVFKRTALFWFGHQGLIGALLTGVICSCLFLILLYLAGKIFRIEEISGLLNKLIRKS
ncbi:Integral membrane protein MviN [uncultured Desulfobacterium sp.]|uniref:Probable lipid II flippase MurJ n=1 Tax=uncultured Desulfobacterium sp. TaxID=201089 RepID=A0A445MUK0_9BACT|nr:Integral membrane protein MviN [uncultured Desulfobacterium sp.]